MTIDRSGLRPGLAWSRIGRRVLAAGMAAGMGASFSYCQVAPAPQPMVYDVVSIKPNNLGGGRVSVHIDDGRYTAINVSLQELLESAYHIKKDLISGLQGPVSSARFDIEAKVIDADPESLKHIDNKTYQAMMLRILTERFQLKAHTETKTLAVYELVVVKGGPKFKQSADDAKGSSGVSLHATKDSVEFTTNHSKMADFATALADQVHRTVIDKTGLTGKYNIELKWSRDDGAAAAESGISLFTALQEQLGLKLQAAKGPVETLVVDSAAMPSEN